MNNIQYKIEVMQAYAEGKEIEFVENTYDAMRANNWRKCFSPIFNWELFNYRVKPEIIEKPSINWDHVSDEFNYLIVNRKGIDPLVWICENKPSYHHSLGWIGTGVIHDARAFKSFNPGDCEPQDSLICRPGF